MWTTRERLTHRGLGEYEGVSEKTSGDPPARRPLPVLVGTPDCIASGERPGLPIITNRSAACSRPLPDACYLAGQDFLDKTNVLDCVFAWWSARIIFAAYENLGDAEALVAELLGPDAVISSFPQIDPTRPAGVVAVVNDTLLLWLTGTTNAQEAAAQAFFFGSGPVELGLFAASAVYSAAALTVADLLTAAGVSDASRIVLAGHSYGGAVVDVLAAIMLIADPDRNIELLTIGAPKPGDRRLIDILNPLRQTHYANERDPIPFLPPQGMDLAGLNPIVNLALAANWRLFARPRHTVLISEGGTLTEVVSDQLPNDLINLLALLIAQVRAAPQFTAHKTEWYIYRLCEACPCVGRPCVRPGEPVLQFELEIIGLEIDGVLGPTTIDLARQEMEQPLPLNFEVNDGANNVAFLAPTAFDELEQPAEWQLTLYWPNFTASHDALAWTFTNDEIISGIETADLPVSGTATVISLDTLRIVPHLV